MVNKKESLLTWLFFLFLGLVLLIINYSWLNLPFYWDTAGFLIPAAYGISQTGNLFSYFSGTDYAHPFLLPLLISFIFRLPVNHVVAIHLFGVFISWFFLIVMFFLGKLFTKRNIAGAFLSLVFISNPLFLAQTHLVYFEIIQTALRYLAIIFLLKRKYILYTVISILAILTREENSVFLILPGLVYVIFDRHIQSKLIWYLKYLLPVIITSISWFILHYLISGWWFFYSPVREFGEKDFLQSLITTIQTTLFYQGRFVVGITIFILIIILFGKKLHKQHIDFPNNWKINFTVLSVAILPQWILIAKNGLLHRYIFPVLPFYYLILFFILTAVIMNKKIWILILLIISFAQISRLYECHNGNYEDCLTVTLITSKKKKASDYLSQYFSKNMIAAGFPENGEITTTYLGYVNIPLQTVDIKTIQPDLIYTSPTSDQMLTDYINKYNYKLIKFFPIAYTRSGLFI